MATTQEKTTPHSFIDTTTSIDHKSTEIVHDWKVSGSDPLRDRVRERESLATMIRPVESLPDPPPTNTNSSTKGLIMNFFS